MKTKTHPITRQEAAISNMVRPSEFLQVKHAIVRAKDEFSLRQAQKMIDRYIFNICPKTMRENHHADLIYIFKYQVRELLSSGVKLPSFEL